MRRKSKIYLPALACVAVLLTGCKEPGMAASMSSDEISASEQESQTADAPQPKASGISFSSQTMNDWEEMTFPDSEEPTANSRGETDGMDMDIHTFGAQIQEVRERGKENKLDLTKLVSDSVGQAQAASAPLTFTQVGDDYFSDALFIGDSLTVGLTGYTNIGKLATAYAKTSMNIQSVFDRPKAIANVGGQLMTVEQALTLQKFGKIYIMLGINEIGSGTTQSYLDTYSRVVQRIRQLQPDAIIYIQSILHVTAKKSQSGGAFSNDRIRERNAALATLANGTDVFYLEINEVMCDAAGNMPADYTTDQVHLKAKYYSLWKNYLLTHAIVKSGAVGQAGVNEQRPPETAQQNETASGSNNGANGQQPTAADGQAGVQQPTTAAQQPSASDVRLQEETVTPNLPETIQNVPAPPQQAVAPVQPNTQASPEIGTQAPSDVIVNP